MPPIRSILASLLKWSLLLGLLCGIGYGLWRLREWNGEPADQQPQSTSPASLEDAGTITFDLEAARRLGIADEPVREIDWSERVVVYGRVIPNARVTTEVRATTAGILRSESNASWPVPGQRIPRGQVLGYVEVRVGPEVRLDLQNKLSEARFRQRGEGDVVKTHERTVESLKKVTDREILSRAELDTALVNLAEAKIQLATAEAAAALWEKSLQEISQENLEANSLWRQPILAPGDGEVTELTGQPGMAVEPGSLILQLVDFRRPLVRIDIPAALLMHGDVPRQITLDPAVDSSHGFGGVLKPITENVPLRHRQVLLVGPAPAIDVSSQFVGYWYEGQCDKDASDKQVSEPGPLDVWRPGLQVRANFRPAGAASQSAIAVPISAVLFHEGRSLVYVHVGDDEYQRREVRLLGREGETWIVSRRKGEQLTGLATGELVVHTQAQVLLSKEFLKGGGDTD